MRRIAGGWVVVSGGVITQPFDPFPRGPADDGFGVHLRELFLPEPDEADGQAVDGGPFANAHDGTLVRAQGAAKPPHRLCSAQTSCALQQLGAIVKFHAELVSAGFHGQKRA
ncbi:hypothetical protein [Minwuia thermotolerans]|uniref:hypothetical protein n=1 Tax=Minwuia thermotolerans TaxID=2056226 RepID=UPI0013DE7986|nr:hypothetical protein [Minwuia thermotolerans]